MEYEDYAKRIRARRKLDMQLDEMNNGVELHLTEIAKEMVDLDVVTPALGLKPRHLRDVRDVNRNNPAAQRYICSYCSDMLENKVARVQAVNFMRLSALEVHDFV